MGMRGQYKNKRDANEGDIFTELRKHGLSVEPMDTPCDAVVGYDGCSYLVEVKNPKGKNELTGKQKLFLETWKGNFTILRTVEEARLFAQVILAAQRTKLIPFRGVAS